MPKNRPLQQSFASGELSPRLLARSDVEGYRSAVAEMTNFISTPHGPAERRFGFEKVLWDNEARLGNVGRLFDFNVSYSRAYVVLVSTTEIIVLDRNGLVDTGNPIANAEFTDGQDNWSVIDDGPGDVLFENGLCTIDGGRNDRHSQSITQQVALTDGTPGMTMVINSLTPGLARFKVGTTAGGDDIFSQDFAGQRASIDFTPGVDTFYITIEVQGDWPIKVLDSLRIYNPEEVPEYVTFPSPYATANTINQLQVAMAPEEDVMYFASRDVQPHKLSLTTTESFQQGVWSFEEVDFLTDEDPDSPGDNIPPPWGASPPGSVTFHEGRLWWGGSYAQPSHIWASNSGEYESLIFGDGDQDTDALEFMLRQRGEIQWMLGAKDLHIGTGKNEVLLVSDGAIITPEDADAKQQTVYGSAKVQGIPLADGVLWTNPSARKMYIAAYSDDRQGYTALDITYPSEHITRGRVKEIEHSISPDTMLIMPTFLGNLVMMTYEPSRQIAGWHKHETDGRILSVCVTEELGISVIYLLVLREADGAQALYLERADRDHFMDSFVHRVFTDDVQVIDGLGHLEGKTVQVLVDDALQPDKVVENGQITLDRPGKNIVIGLQYVSKLKTLPLDILSQEGSQASKQKRFNRIFVRLLDSARPVINGENPRKRTPSTPMGEREPNRTEDVVVHNLGWDKYASIEVEMELPFACNVLGVFGEVGIEGL